MMIDDDDDDDDLVHSIVTFTLSLTLMSFQKQKPKLKLSNLRVYSNPASPVIPVEFLLNIAVSLKKKAAEYRL